MKTVVVGVLRKEGILSKEEAMALFEIGLSELSLKDLELNAVVGVLSSVKIDMISDFLNSESDNAEGSAVEDDNTDDAEKCTCQGTKNDGTPCTYSPKFPEEDPKYCGVHWKQVKWAAEKEAKEKAKKEQVAKTKAKREKERKEFMKINDHVYVKDGVAFVDLRDLDINFRKAKRVVFGYATIELIRFPKDDNLKYHSHYCTLVGKDVNDKREVKASYKRLNVVSESNHFTPGQMYSGELAQVHTALLIEAFKRYKVAKEEYLTAASK